MQNPIDIHIDVSHLQNDLAKQLGLVVADTALLLTQLVTTLEKHGAMPEGAFLVDLEEITRLTPDKDPGVVPRTYLLKVLRQIQEARKEQRSG